MVDLDKFKDTLAVLAKEFSIISKPISTSIPSTSIPSSSYTVPQLLSGSSSAVPQIEASTNDLVMVAHAIKNLGYSMVLKSIPRNEILKYLLEGSK